MALLCSYIGLAVQNHALTQTLAQRVTENLRLMASLHGFYDTALEAFATAIDVKHVNIHGHSLRVGRYAAAIGEAMGAELPMPVRIMALADTFDAMTSTRPYRESLSLGSALSDLVRMSPLKYDPNVVQAFLIQVRRDAVGSARTPLLADHMPVNIAPSDVDQLAATLQHKVSRGKVYLT